MRPRPETNISSPKVSTPVKKISPVIKQTHVNQIQTGDYDDNYDSK